MFTCVICLTKLEHSQKLGFYRTKQTESKQKHTWDQTELSIGNLTNYSIHVSRGPLTYCFECMLDIALVPNKYHSFHILPPITLRKCLVQSSVSVTIDSLAIPSWLWKVTSKHLEQFQGHRAYQLLTTQTKCFF